MPGITLLRIAVLVLVLFANQCTKRICMRAGLPCPRSAGRRRRRERRHRRRSRRCGFSCGGGGIASSFFASNLNRLPEEIITQRRRHMQHDAFHSASRRRHWSGNRPRLKFECNRQHWSGNQPLVKSEKSADSAPGAIASLALCWSHTEARIQQSLPNSSRDRLRAVGNSCTVLSNRILFTEVCLNQIIRPTIRRR